MLQESRAPALISSPNSGYVFKQSEFSQNLGENKTTSHQKAAELKDPPVSDVALLLKRCSAQTQAKEPIYVTTAELLHP